MADTTAPPQEGDEVTSGVLYRRIFPNRDYFKPPPENRITSLNFLPAKGEADVSMYRAAETTPSEVLEGHDGFGLLMLDAEQLWGIGKRVVYTPKFGKGHVSVYGFSKQDEQARKDAAFSSRLLISPALRS